MLQIVDFHKLLIRIVTLSFQEKMNYVKIGECFLFR